MAAPASWAASLCFRPLPFQRTSAQMALITSPSQFQNAGLLELVATTDMDRTRFQFFLSSSSQCLLANQAIASSAQRRTLLRPSSSPIPQGSFWTHLR